jgi:diadenylate cyclase
MPDLRNAILDTLGRLDSRAILDILLVAAMFYAVLRLLRGTAAMSLLRGVAIIVVLIIALGSIFQLTVLSWLLRNGLIILGLSIPIVFQPELRRALERVGRASFGAPDSEEFSNTVRAVARAVIALSERRHGALIAFERETGLREYIETGIRLNAEVSSELLETIFQRNSALHDGAVIIQNHRVAAASCVFPLGPQPPDLPMLGTRHRAAIGVTQDRDAICVVVSEETGLISLARNGRLIRGLEPRAVEHVLLTLFTPRSRRRGFTLPRWRLKKESTNEADAERSQPSHRR